MKIKKKTIFLSLVILFLFISNVFFLKLYLREQNRLKNAVIPSLTNDYYTSQKVITDYLIQKENYQTNLLNPILELSLGSTFPYNIYFNTKEEYAVFRKENANKKDVPLILQNPYYPNGCESASTIMLLNYMGIDITISDFINHYLEKDSVYESDGERYGPNPALVYAGDPTSSNRGWGAFEPVMAKAITKVLEDYHRENDIYLILSEYDKQPLYLLASKRYPAIIWVTIDYQEANTIYNWRSYDGKYTYTYPKNSHTVVLTGMDENYYYINDPLKEEKNIKVPKEQLENSFDSMGRQFISLKYVKNEVE